MRSLKVVVVDDSLAVQERLARMLATLPGVEIAGYARDVAKAIGLIDAVRPDLVMLDVELANGDLGIGVVHHVMRQHPGTRVIALSNFNWQAMQAIYLQAGAQAYFDKSLEFMKAKDWVAALLPSVPAQRT